MEEVKNFLRVSTIHGLFHVNTEKTWSKIFWIFVVFGGFSWAGYMIHSSILNWYQTPISTTIESLPISQMKFPNITVCPPRNSILNLNYDIKMKENIKLSKVQREDLLAYAINVSQNKFYDEIMTNLSKVEDSDRYSNWYNGLTKVSYPYYKKEDNRVVYFLYFYAP